VQKIVGVHILDKRPGGEMETMVSRRTRPLIGLAHIGYLRAETLGDIGTRISRSVINYDDLGRR
jgi:hypothetical protein